jgi:hypothetical protein
MSAFPNAPDPARRSNAFLANMQITAFCRLFSGASAVPSIARCENLSMTAELLIYDC